jgi:hypothetical protein
MLPHLGRAARAFAFAAIAVVPLLTATVAYASEAGNGRVTLDDVSTTAPDGTKFVIKHAEFVNTNLDRGEVEKLLTGVQGNERLALLGKLKAERISIPSMEVFEKGGGVFHLHGFEAVDVDSGKFGAISFADIDGSGADPAEKTIFKLGAFRATDLDFARALNADGKAPNPFHIARLSTLDLKSLDLVAPDNESAGRTLHLAVASFHLDGAYDGDIPKEVAAAVQGLVLQTAPGSQFATQLAMFGYSRLEFSAAIKAHYDTNRKALELEDFTLDAPQAGAIDLKASFGGVDLAKLVGDESARRQALLAMSLASLDVSLANTGLFEKALAFFAKQQGATPDALKQKLLTTTIQAAPLFLGAGPESTKNAEELRKFIESPNALAISVKARGGPLKATDLQSAPNPITITSALQISILANPPDKPVASLPANPPEKPVGLAPAPKTSQAGDKSDVILDDFTSASADGTKIVIKHAEFEKTNLERDEVEKLLALDQSPDDKLALIRKLKAEKISIPSIEVIDRNRNAIQLRDFKANDVDSGQAGALSVSAIDGAVEGDASNQKIVFHSGALGLKVLDFSGTLTAAFQKRAVVPLPRLAAIDLQSFDLVVPTTEHDVAMTLHLAFGSFEFHCSYDGEVPRQSSVALGGLVIESSPGSEIANSLAMFGGPRVELSASIAAHYEADTKALAFDDLSIHGARIGDLTLKARFGDVEPTLFIGSDADRAQALLGSSFASIEGKFVDAGLSESLLAFLAQKRNTTPEGLRRQLFVELTGAGLPALGGGPDSLKVVAEALTFVQQPKSLTVTIKAKDAPLTISEIATAKEPAAVASKLQISALANAAAKAIASPVAKAPDEPPESTVVSAPERPAAPAVAKELDRPVASLAPAPTEKPATVSRPERRVALVVANAAYRGAPLGNPTVDADIVAASLASIGFDVKVSKNLDLGAFDTAVNAFAEDAKGADVAVFYFAGHGFTVSEGVRPVSVLMSISADVAASSERVLKAGGIPLDEIVGSLAGQARATLVFVDACRNDPRVSRAVGGKGRGFDRLEPVVGGSLFIGLSTRLGETAQDGDVGKGSPFARAFAATMQAKGVRVDDAFRLLRDAVKAETDGKQIPDVVQDDLPNGALTLAR